mmetsp:Transcript_119501/g.320749  ORF Transcript_119501/g.320749 Transcript_119501/m.320749 type:complete len:394 (+) Transcript_119501:516-1697(+)
MCAGRPSAARARAKPHAGRALAAPCRRAPTPQRLVKDPLPDDHALSTEHFGTGWRLGSRGPAVETSPTWLTVGENPAARRRRRWPSGAAGLVPDVGVLLHLHLAPDLLLVQVPLRSCVRPLEQLAGPRVQLRRALRLLRWAPARLRELLVHALAEEHLHLRGDLPAPRHQELRLAGRVVDEVVDELADPLQELLADEPEHHLLQDGQAVGASPKESQQGLLLWREVEVPQVQDGYREGRGPAEVGEEVDHLVPRADAVHNTPGRHDSLVDVAELECVDADLHQEGQTYSNGDARRDTSEEHDIPEKDRHLVHLCVQVVDRQKLRPLGLRLEKTNPDRIATNFLQLPGLNPQLEAVDYVGRQHRRYLREEHWQYNHVQTNPHGSSAIFCTFVPT